MDRLSGVLVDEQLYNGELIGVPCVDMDGATNIEQLETVNAAGQEAAGGAPSHKSNGFLHDIGKIVRDEIGTLRGNPAEPGKHNMTEGMLIEMAAREGAKLALQRLGLGMLKDKGEN